MCGYEIGWMTPGRAANHLERVVAWDKLVLSVQVGGASVLDCYLVTTGVEPDFDRSVAAVQGQWLRVVKGEKDYPLHVSLDEDRFSLWVAGLKKILDKAPVDATFALGSSGNVEIVPERPGLEVDVDALREALLQNGIWQQIPEAIHVVLREVPASRRTEDLQRFMPLVKISEFSTWFDSGNDRAFNIGLAAKAVDGVVLWPGEVFSFNQRTGPRTLERGYRKAPVVVGSKLVDDYGGGVCQVSSTVYVSMLKAGLTVVERHNHGLPVSYIPLGLDATVSYEYLDLKMRNDFDFPVLVDTLVSGGMLSCAVYGMPAASFSVELQTKVLSEIPGVLVDENGVLVKKGFGYVVETLRVFRSGNEVVKVENLGTSVYAPTQTAPSTNLPPN